MSTDIPPEARQKLLPDPTLSIIELLQFSHSFPPIVSGRVNAADFASTEAPQITDIDAVRALPVPPLDTVRTLAGTISPETRSIKTPHVLSKKKSFPLWTISYWLDDTQERRFGATMMRMIPKLRKNHQGLFIDSKRKDVDNVGVYSISICNWEGFSPNQRHASQTKTPSHYAVTEAIYNVIVQAMAPKPESLPP
ncbi:hypothetical protein H0H81_010086 [Sphagnurus paluster]|uniref:Uncharacterized protein n=1 Tax=Sphagnurus paluster TaxID=117069 RepID=A0A9P7FT67_9AGAR|nr:hypothetical protein H0H81_010086 [Sphagnurus paluster]